MDEILSCDVIEPAPMGVIREITMPGSNITQGDKSAIVRIKERVVIDESTQSLLFFQLEASGQILLFAINQVKEQNNCLYFSGHYVYNIKKNSKEKSDQDFMVGSNKILPMRVCSIIDRMKALAHNGKKDDIYRLLYG